MNPNKMWEQNYHQDQHILHRGCEPNHAYFIPFHNEQAAMTGDREKSDRFVSLCGDWMFRYYPSLAMVEDIDKTDAMQEKWDTIPVPMSWQMALGKGYDLPAYRDLDYPFPVDPPYVSNQNPCGLYQKTFFVSENMLDDKRLHLVFEGVDSCFYLYVNDRFVGYSQVSHSTSEFDVSAFVHEGINQIKVLVLKWCDGTYLEDQDKFRLSGIFREVYLLLRDSVCLQDIYVRNILNEEMSQGEIRITADFTGDTDFAWCLYAPDGLTVSKGTQTTQGGQAQWGIPVTDPQLWSDETPRLYSLVITAGEEVIREQVGMRHFEIKGKVLYVNGQPVKGKGVNRHDSHPELGAATPKDHMLRDLHIMKACNINMVRTSHYPNDPRFLQWCDQLGLYVCNEADLEAHGVDYVEGFGRDALSDDPTWTTAYVDRAERLMERDKNRTCVLMWSVGNESGIGRNLKAMADYFHQRMPGCIVHNERYNFVEYGIRKNDPQMMELKKYVEGEPYFDIDSMMYVSAQDSQSYINSELSVRPYFLCEYCHSMGNSPGDLKTYWDIIYAHEGFFGGCVWEFTDHAVNAGTVESPRYLYGGDFGEALHEANFCMDGMVYPDRRIHTGLLEYKQILAPCFVTDFCEEQGTVTIKSRRYFTDTSDLTLHYTVEENGEITAQGSISPFIINPGEEKTFGLQLGNKGNKRRRYLNLYFRTNRDHPWAPCGHQVGMEQIRLTDGTEELFALPKGLRNIQVADQEQTIIVTDGETAYTVCKTSGEIIALTHGGKEMLTAPIAFNLWRAPTDNDRLIRVKWQKHGYDRMRSDLRSLQITVNTPEEAVIRAQYRIAAEAQPVLADLVVQYRFCSEKGLEIQCDFSRRKPAEFTLPRLGLQFAVDKGFENLRYFGRGPMESYWDKQLAARMGLFTSTVSDHFEHYPKPQENMAHADTRLMELWTDDGYGIQITGAQDTEDFSFNCSHYTPKQIAGTKHDFELVEREETVVNIDYRQCGIGSNSCGPELAPEYSLMGDAYRYAFRLLPMTKK